MTPQSPGSETLARIALGDPVDHLRVAIVDRRRRLFAGAMVGFACDRAQRALPDDQRRPPFQLVAFAAAAGMIVAAYFGDQSRSLLALAAASR